MGWLIDWLIISLSLSLSPYRLFRRVDWLIYQLFLCVTLSPLHTNWLIDCFSLSVSSSSIPTKWPIFQKNWFCLCLLVFYSDELSAFFLLILSLFCTLFKQIDCFFYQFSLRLLICILFWPNRLFEWLILTLYLYLLFRRVDWSIDSLSVSLSPIHDCWRIDWFSFCLIISSSDLLINYL